MNADMNADDYVQILMGDEQEEKDKVIQQLLDYEKAGYLKITRTDGHTTGIRLMTMNYTEKQNATPVSDWHPLMTLSRGMVISQTSTGYDLVVDGLRKFHSHHRDENIDLMDGDQDKMYSIMTKYDGSCINIAYIESDDNMYVGTRNGPRGDQAGYAREILQHGGEETVKTLYLEHNVRTIHAELLDKRLNRTVPYLNENPSLVIISARHRDGAEYDHAQLETLANMFENPQITHGKAEHLNGAQLKEKIQELNEGVSSYEDILEGFVVRTSDGVMYKVKGRQYLEVDHAPRPNLANIMKVKGKKKKGKKVFTDVESYIAFANEKVDTDFNFDSYPPEFHQDLRSYLDKQIDEEATKLSRTLSLAQAEIDLLVDSGDVDADDIRSMKRAIGMKMKVDGRSPVLKLAMSLLKKQQY